MTAADTDPTASPLNLWSLEAYLLGAGVELQGELTAVPIEGGRSNLTYIISDGTSRWILRRPPMAGLTPSAHDVGREYKVVDALQGTGVPVARTLMSCTDTSVIGAPFAMVSFVDGQVFRTTSDLDVLNGLQIGQVHSALIQVLADLHAVPYREVGLADFGRPEGYVERQIKRWWSQWGLVATRELPEVERLYDKLRATPPRGAGESIVHGDYRIDNTLVTLDEAPRIAAVVDWELSTLGDPITDVAMMCVYQSRQLDHIIGGDGEQAASTSDRWPDATATAQEYAWRSGRDLGDFDQYLAFAHFKLAIIAEGIASRYLAGAGEGAGYATAGLAVPGLIEAGLAVVR